MDGLLMATYQRKDHFHQRAKSEGYQLAGGLQAVGDPAEAPSSAQRSDRVADLGCWPGGWLQVAAEAVGPARTAWSGSTSSCRSTRRSENANVVSLYRRSLGDAIAREKRSWPLLGGAAADIVLSDAAPKLTGVRPTDRAREEDLLQAIEAMLSAVLRPGGTLLLKVLDGPEAQAATKRLRARFESGRILKPRASRRGTSERYLLARRFRPGAAGQGGGLALSD